LETYANDLGAIYANSEIDSAMSNAYKQTRKFLMAQYGLTEPEANTIITQGVDFAITQVVDGNWGVHSVIPKKIFEQYLGDSTVNGGVQVNASVAEGKAGTSSLGEADLPLSHANVHWGFFSKELEPVLTITSGQEVVVEMATHHACDDWDKMIGGDEG
jgi:acetamidase/formamidase